MTEPSNQEVSVSLMADTAFGVDLDVRYLDDVNEPSGETRNASRKLAASSPALLLRILAVFSCCSGDKKSVTVPRSAGKLADDIEEFILGMQRYWNNIYGEELSTGGEESYRVRLSAWNVFLQLAQGVRGTSGIISLNINKDINKFNLWMEEHLGAQWTGDDKERIKKWLRRWNMFLQAREGGTLVTGCNLFLTIVGFTLYLVDLASDIGAAIFFASNGQWWQALVTLAIIYGTIIMHTTIKWTFGQVHCTGAADWLRYGASLLVNWPDMKLYGALCRLEWQLHRSPEKNARLVPEWDQWRYNVALLKFTEGVCEACPQAILQLYFLVPDLYGAWTWTDYLRIAGACVSLCTAGAAFANMEKCKRIAYHIDLPLGELVVLHVWAVPLTVSRLLSVALLLSVYPFWALAGGSLHLVLRGVYWCRTMGVPRELYGVIPMCRDTLQFGMSPFDVAVSIMYRRVVHVIHLLVNTAMTVGWAIGTPLVCAHQALYTAIICFSAGMFVVGLVAWQLHEKYWPGSYLKV